MNKGTVACATSATSFIQLTPALIVPGGGGGGGGGGWDEMILGSRPLIARMCPGNTHTIFQICLKCKVLLLSGNCEVYWLVVNKSSNNMHADY